MEELSKKVAYLKGLMEGLKIDEESPEGQILNVMADILSDMADEVEECSYALNAISDYIDFLEEGADPLNEIDTYEYGFDPVKGEQEESADAAEGNGGSSEPAQADEGNVGDENNDDNYDESIRFSEFLGNIMSAPDYSDDSALGSDSFKLIETLKNMVVKGYEEQELEEAKKRAEGLPVPHVLNDRERDDFITKLEDLLSTVSDDEDEEEDLGLDQVIGRMKCPFCHHDIQLKVGDIAEKVIGCPSCGNRLTIML
ncbi:MAG: hypothetical protein K6B74_14155 [Ruminococcus sp.]|nr:hypothetical protein [Ruminococcus sp.]